MNLPALTTTPGEMASALDRVAGVGTSQLIDWTADAAVAAIVRSWPARFTTRRAAELGLAGEPTFDNIIREYINENEGAT